MRLGVLARADQSGIAAQSLAVVKHLKPEKVLALDLGAYGRGPTMLGEGDYPARVIEDSDAKFRYEMCETSRAWPRASDRALRWLCDGMDTVYVVETPMSHEFGSIAANMGVRVWVHANPELWMPSRYGGPTTKVALPTTWHSAHINHQAILPMPVDREDFPFRQRLRARTFMVMGSPAMEDRNGAALVYQALQYVERPIRVLTRGLASEVGAGRVEEVGKTVVEHLGPVRDHRCVFPELADVLVIPRRYGGLSLPMQEAASLGMPIITLDVEPQNEWVPRAGLVHAEVERSEPMKGGQFELYTANPESIARAMTDLVLDQELTAHLSNEMDDYAEFIAWHNRLGEWQKVLAS